MSARSAAVRVLEAASGGGVNGAGQHCLLLCRELSRRGHDVTLLCRPGAWIARQPGLGGVAVIESSLRRVPSEIRRVAALCRGRAIDVVHTHMSSAHAYGVILRLFFGIPAVATAHSQKLQLHWALNDHVIATSHAAARFHRRVNLVRRRRISVVPNFVDATRVAAITPETRARARGLLGLPDDAIVVGCVGDICARKRQLSLVRALSTLIARDRRIRLVLIGAWFEPRVLAQIRAEIASRDLGAHVILTGPRDDAPMLLPALDVFALPSAMESMPVALLEAMAAGLPAIATPVGDVADMLDGGKAGVLVDVDRPDALAAGLLALVGDAGLRRRMSEAGQARMLARYAPEAAVPRIEAILAAVAARRPVPPA